MSAEPLLPPGRPTPEQPGPAARLIADAVHRCGGQRKAATAVTDASYDISRNRQSVAPSTVGDWMTGAIPGPTMIQWIAAGLHIPPAELEAAVAAQKRARREARLQQKAESQPLPHPVESEDVRRTRREFAEFLAGFGVSAATGIDFDRYASVLAGTRADERALDDFEQVTLNLIRQERTDAAHALVGAVRGHLASLRDILVWTPPTLARRAYSLAGQTALLAGYLYYKQDHYDQADMYWVLADRLGNEAGDVRLRAALLEHRASRWTQHERENLPYAVELLDAAMRLIGSAPDPALAAYILSFRARRLAEASRTQPAYAAQAMYDLDALQTCLSRMPSVDTSIYVIESVRGEALQGRGRVLVHVGRPSDALAELEQSLASIGPESHSWRAGIVADIAAAHAAMGELEHASDLLTTSLRLASQPSSPRHLTRIRQARQRWLADHDGPALRRLDDQLRALPPASASADSPPAISA